MEAKLLERPVGWIMGITARVRPESADYQDLWQNRFCSREAEIAGLAVEKGYFGVYYGTWEPGWVDFVAGMAVGAGVRAPEGLVVRELPPGRCASFRCTMATIAKTWSEIYRDWLPASPFVEDQVRPCLEHFVPSGPGGETEVTIYLPILDK